jgi:hypothetical protein
MLAERGFSTMPVVSLQNLLNLNAPAIVEISPGRGEKPRFVALTTSDGGSFGISPAITPAGSVSIGELAAVWTGRGQIIWKNSRNIPVNLGRSSSGEGVVRLQGLLRDAGLAGVEQTGRLDGPTREAIRTVQRAAGLTADGIPGDRTLLVLYRDYGREKFPRLSAVTESRP